jgi:hypothetical protein
MKINNMRMLAIGLLVGMIGGIFAGLFFVAIPSGNGDVMYMALGMIIDNLGHMLSSTFNGRFKNE